MRYEVRWSNGYWKLFDTSEYTSVDLFYTQAEAERACERANTPKRG